MTGGILGVNVNEIVDGIMKYKRKGLEGLTRKESIYEYQKAAYTDFKARLKEFETAFSSFQSILNKNHYKTESANESILSVAVNSNDIATGEYEVSVTQLAKAHKISSQAYASKTDALGLSSDLNIEIQGNVMSINLAVDDSLETIQNKINNSADNPGVRASVLKVTGAGGDDEYVLMLNSENTGEDYSLNLTGLAVTDLDISNEITAAQNAEFTLNNFSVVRNSNLVNDLIDGVSLNLNGALGDTSFRIMIDKESEQEALQNQFQTFIDKYNKLMEMTSAHKADSFLRDSTYSIIQKQLQHLMSGSYGEGDVHQLLELGTKTMRSGIQTNEEGVEYAVTGRLEFDSTRFKQLLNDDIESVRSLFNDSSTGLAAAFKETTHALEEETIFTRETIINRQLHDIQDRIFAEEDRLESIRASLIKQYTAVEKIVSKYEMLGNFLDMQLDHLFNSKGKK